nr:neurogenic locus protein delta-like [Dermatophagoides farinae]
MLIIIVIILIHLFITHVSCLGIFQLRLDRFVNEYNRDASGRCCGAAAAAAGHNNTTTSTTICKEKCQTFFRICFKNYQANIDTNSNCLYGEKLTPVLSPITTATSDSHHHHHHLNHHSHHSYYRYIFINN